MPSGKARKGVIRSRSERHELVVAVIGSVGPDEIADLQVRVAALLGEPDPRPIVCDVSRVVDPDMSAIEALARVQLAARRAGREIRFRHPCPRLHELIDLAGLCNVLMCEGAAPNGLPEARPRGKPGGQRAGRS